MLTQADIAPLLDWIRDYVRTHGDPPKRSDYMRDRPPHLPSRDRLERSGYSWSEVRHLAGHPVVMQEKAKYTASEHQAIIHGTIGWIRRYYRRFGNPPTMSLFEQCKPERYPSASWLRDRGWSWRKLCEEAGVPFAGRKQDERDVLPSWRQLRVDPHARDNGRLYYLHDGLPVLDCGWVECVLWDWRTLSYRVFEVAWVR